jgi:hypothetical protein
MMVVLISVLGTLAAAGLLVWLLWPDRKGGVASATEVPDELDRMIADVRNVDRPRQPGESGFGGDGSA